MKVLEILLVASLASLASAGGMGIDRDIKDKLDRYNLYSACFGPDAVAKYYASILQAGNKCMKEEFTITTEINSIADLLPNPLVASRKKRQAESFQLSAEDIEELKTEAQDHIGMIMMKMSNLTCVLRQLEWLDDEGQINMNTFSYDKVKEYLKNTPPGQDEDFVQAMVRGYADCGEISKDWPQSTLEKNAMLKAFGRQKVFMKCMFRLEQSMCYKYDWYVGMKNFYGFDADVVDLGLPGDKFEAAMNFYKLTEELEPERKYIDDFFWSNWARM